jgi:hypothetical protein
MPDKLEDVELYAWLGEDELGSGEIGLKQALVPAGMIPMVAIRRDKVDRQYIEDAMDQQGKTYGKKIYLCRFKLEKVEKEVGYKG